MKYYLRLDVDVQVEVPIEADTLEEAIEKSKNEDYELPNLNDSFIGDTRLAYITDEDWNIVKYFE